MKGSKWKAGKKASKHAKRNSKGPAKSDSHSPNAQERARPGSTGRPDSHSAKSSQKLTGQRRRDITGNLRFLPVEFVAARGEFRLELEPVQQEELADEEDAASSSDESAAAVATTASPPIRTDEPTGGSSGEANDDPNGDLNDDLNGELNGELNGDRNGAFDGGDPNMLRDRAPGRDAPELPTGASGLVPALPAAVDSDEELLGTMDEDELDEMIHADITVTMEDPDEAAAEVSDHMDVAITPDGEDVDVDELGRHVGASTSSLSGGPHSGEHGAQGSDSASDVHDDADVDADVDAVVDANAGPGVDAGVDLNPDLSPDLDSGLGSPSNVDENLDVNMESVDESISDYEAEQKDVWEADPSRLDLLRDEGDSDLADISDGASESGGGGAGEKRLDADAAEDADEDSAEDEDDVGPEEYSNLFALDSSDEDNRLHVTLDDYELSDASSVEQDYMDNMSELDDDQIFALASSSVARGVHDFENQDVFDKYDEYDEYFDELLADGPLVSDRKKLKRQAREAMHAIKFGKLPPLWEKYPRIMLVREVLEELRIFAGQAGASLAFPPLDNNANWYVKELAQEHGMTPKVVGANYEKYVVVQRTNRTNSVGGKKMHKLLNRRQAFPRSDVLDKEKKQKAKKGAPAASTKGGAKAGAKAGGPKPSARPTHGHIVGHNAAEISKENFGHRMLVQMGWTEGSGLGRGKEGITAPIPAMVKLTKTGLGGV